MAKSSQVKLPAIKRQDVGGADETTAAALGSISNFDDEVFFITDTSAESSLVKNYSEWKDSIAYDSEGKIIHNQFAHPSSAKHVSFLDSPSVSPALKSTSPTKYAHTLKLGTVSVNRSIKVQPPRPKRRMWVLNVVIISIAVLVVIIVAIGVFIATQFSKAGCSTYFRERCTKGHGECFLDQNSQPYCRCFRNENGTDFYWIGDECTQKGLGYAQDLADVFNLTTAMVNGRCGGGKSKQDAACAVTCDDLLRALCLNPNATWDVCGSETIVDHLGDLTDFACQRNGPNGYFRELFESELPKCEEDVDCRLLMRFYPCYAGYINNGTLQCASDQNCVSKTPMNGSVLALYGHCIHKTDTCEAAIQTLSEVVRGSTIAYAYDKDTFDSDPLYEDVVNASLHLRSFVYPLMLAYDTMSHVDRTVEVFPISETTFHGNDTLKIRAFYADDHELSGRFFDKVNHTARVAVDDPARRIMQLVANYSCADRRDCPPLEKAQDVVRFWLRHAAGHCVLASSLYSRNLSVDAASYEAITRKREANFSTETVSLIYTPVFISRLLGRIDSILIRKRLTQNEFSRSKELCLEGDALTTGEHGTVVSVVLFEKLWLKNGYRDGLDEISKFALILANDRSVKRAICDTTEQVPSIDCELRLYLAFVSFFPSVTVAEAQLFGSDNKAVVYFSLRSATRSLLDADSLFRMAPFTRSEQRSSMSDIRTASQAVVDQCLGQLRD